LRHQPALLFLELLDAPLRHLDEVALLRFGLRGQRRGGALGVVLAAAVEIGLRQHRRLRGFTADFELTSTTSSCGSERLISNTSGAATRTISSTACTATEMASALVSVLLDCHHSRGWRGDGEQERRRSRLGWADGGGNRSKRRPPHCRGRRNRLRL
jgi:hypothetical protein